MNDQGKELLKLKNEVVSDILCLTVFKKNIACNHVILIQLLDFLITKKNFNAEIQVLDYLRNNDEDSETRSLSFAYQDMEGIINNKNIIVYFMDFKIYELSEVAKHKALNSFYTLVKVEDCLRAVLDPNKAKSKNETNPYKICPSEVAKMIASKMNLREALTSQLSKIFKMNTEEQLSLRKKVKISYYSQNNFLNQKIRKIFQLPEPSEDIENQIYKDFKVRFNLLESFKDFADDVLMSKTKYDQDIDTELDKLFDITNHEFNKTLASFANFLNQNEIQHIILDPKFELFMNFLLTRRGDQKTYSFLEIKKTTKLKAKKFSDIAGSKIATYIIAKYLDTEGAKKSTRYRFKLIFQKPID